MKRLIGIFIFLLICVSSPVYADNKDLVQYIGDSYTQGYSKDGPITGDGMFMQDKRQVLIIHRHLRVV